MVALSTFCALTMFVHHSPHHHALLSLREGEQHGRRRRVRMFEAGDLKLLTLYLIAQQPRHGYDLIRTIGRLVGGGYLPSHGTIYPVLNTLEDLGYAAVSHVVGARKQYCITDEGRLVLQDQMPAVQQLMHRLAQRQEHRSQPYPSSLVRAMENFKTALRFKLKGQPDALASNLSDAQLAAIAAIFDKAAMEIVQA